MNRGQKKRVISRPDDEHEAEWLTLDFKRNAVQPERTFSSSVAARREHARGAFLEPATGIGQREDFGDELLGDRSIVHRRGRHGEGFGIVREPVAKFSDDSQSLRDRFRVPNAFARRALSRRLSFILSLCGSSTACIRQAPDSWARVAAPLQRSLAGAIPRSARRRRALIRADSKITGNPLPGMRAAADEINAIDILEAVVRTKMQHLIEAMRQVEGRALVNFVFLDPNRPA